jgi:hypothetical protein
MPGINLKTIPVVLGHIVGWWHAELLLPFGQVEFPTRHWLTGHFGICLVDLVNRLPSVHTNDTTRTQLLYISCPVD